MLGQEGKTDFKPFHLRKTATQDNNTMWRQAVFIVMPELNNRYGSVSSEFTPTDLVTEYSCVFHACRSATPRPAGWRAVRHYCIKTRQRLWIGYTLYKCDIHNISTSEIMVDLFLLELLCDCVGINYRLSLSLQR